ncbi:STE/STE11/cdc15 protein kinase [Pseudohyphozyma bogoriensis]|nr:STE/STE11/cdc15 protein kinase [Pseudohyphozyma bogoriensis]
MSQSKGQPANASPTPALPSYSLGEKLGVGAFGTVWRAFNWETGETVAVKQIGLSNIPKSELPDIMSEIDLLKNLHHPNIVQYRGFVKTSDFLFIILEFCENGSLQTITKKFGRFPESLVALYILQVLQGLLYLHDQGVIHRDIKGSNILATKEGNIKLADFGVATQAGGPEDANVVGSPYWMAPEVVDQSGATTASDIWSLGALVIELLTGKPPYHFLDPLPALFRIVNDDCPPIPESASAGARDFLLQCFQKDRNLRIGARKLLRHPWIMAAKKGVESREREAGLGRRLGGVGVERPLSGYDTTVQQVQEWNEALKSAPARHSEEHPRLTRRPSADVASALQAPLPMPSPASAKVEPSLPLSLMRAEGPPSPAAEERESDNWDLDFEEGISISKIAALDRESSPSEEDNDDEDEEDGFQDANATIRPSHLASPSPAPRPPPMEAMAPIVEDYSDLLDEEEDAFEGRVAKLREEQTDTTRKRILHPKDISDSFARDSPSSTVNNLTMRKIPFPSAPERPSIPQSVSKGSSLSTASSIERFSEEDEEDYSDVFGSLKAVGVGLASDAGSLGDEESDEEDPFAEVEEDGFDESDLESNLARDKFARLCAFVSELIDSISSESDEYALREASLELITILEDSPEIKSHFVKSHGMLAVMETLQAARSREIIGILLRVVNLIVGSDPDSLEKLCLVGGCPVVMSFASNKFSREIRLEAALFIGSMCRTSLLTMFVSCRGLKTLVDMMDENYAERKDLVWMAVDGITRVFELHGPTPRNDFCRIFAHEGLLEPLSNALLQVAKDDDDLAESAKVKIVHIFLIFAQADRKIKEAMCTRTIILRLVKVISILDPELLAILLKTLKNLTMLPSALEVLQNANVIEELVNVLAQDFDGKLAAEIQNHIVNSLFNLCRLSKNRQEEAAVAGAVPILQRVVQGSSPLKQFALPIICDFAHASKTCRRILWKHDGLNFYLSLLKDPFWANPALEAIVSWLQDETARVEDHLLEPVALDLLLRVFCRAKTTAFENMLEPFHKLLRTSTSVSAKLAVQPPFFKRIIDRLGRGGKAVVRLNLLRITKTVFDSLSDRRDKVVKVPHLFTTVSKLASDDPAVLVKELATKLQSEFAATREEAGHATKRNLVSRVFRRSFSGPSPGSGSPGKFGSPGKESSKPSTLRRSGTLFGRA